MRLFGFFIKLFFVLIFFASIAAGSITVLSLQDNPLVNQRHNLTAREINRINRFIYRNNPSRFIKNIKRTVIISQQDINLLAIFTLRKFYKHTRTNIKFFNSSAYITATIKLSDNPLGNYLNVSAQIIQQDNSLSIKSLSIGDISIPDFISDLLLITAHRELQKQLPEYRIAVNSLSHFKFTKQQFSISFIWRTEVIDRLTNRIADSLLTEDLRQRLFIYTKELQKTIKSIVKHRVSLTELLRPMFSFALKRSENNDPVEENRALFIVLGAHMINKNIPQLLGDKSIGRLKFKRYLLLKRSDLSQHFLVSAALTALSNPALAQTIGLEKEIKDSGGGSGFSFSDLAADRAGITLANTALASKQQAHLVQKRLSTTYFESDFMPNINSLQDGLQDIDFKMIYTDTNSTAYKRVIEIIDKRIASCNIYR